MVLLPEPVPLRRRMILSPIVLGGFFMGAPREVVLRSMNLRM